MLTFSFYRAPIAQVKPCRVITISDVYKYLTWEKIENKTADFRALSDIEKKKQKPLIFDYITPGGVFSRRHLDGLLSVSGYIILDFDHLEPDGVGLFCSFCLPVVCSFVSPSGCGVKVICDYSEIFKFYSLDKLDFTAREAREYAARVYSEYWAITAQIIRRESGGKYDPDPSGRDITRACFLCYDKDAYLWDIEKKML